MNRQELEAVINTQIDGSDLFIVDITISPSMDIEVTMDSDTKVLIDQCIAITRAVEAAFDRQVQDYSLTVGSAGIGNPIKLARQFDKIVGKDVAVVLQSGVKVHCLLQAHDDQGITVSYMSKEVVPGKKRKVEIEKTEKYNFSDIKTVCEALLV